MYDICLLFDDVTVYFNLIGVQDSEPDTSPHSGYGWGRDYPHTESSEYICSRNDGTETGVHYGRDQLFPKDQD